MRAFLRPIVALLLVLAGPFLLVKGTIDYLAERDLDANGIAVMARVVGVEIKHKRKTEDDYKIDLQFKTAEGKAMTDTIYISVREIPRPRDGQEIPILYRPSDPTLTKIVGTSSDAWLMPFVGIGTFVVGIGMFLYRG